MIKQHKWEHVGSEEMPFLCLFMEVIPDCTTTTSVKCTVLRIERVYSD